MADDSQAFAQKFGADPFADILAGDGVPAPAAARPPALGTTPEDKLGPDPFGDILNPPEEETSSFGAFTRSAVRNVLPAAGGLATMGAGAETGALAGSFFGPFGAAAGGVIGGIAGALGGSYIAGSAQDYAVKSLPDSWQEAIGQDDRQQQLDREYHPTASFLGGMLPYALTMKPGFDMAAKTLPENATAFQKILANPVTARLFGGAIQGGMEAGQEQAFEGHVDWTNVAIATGFGIVFNKPTQFGEAITGAGARPVRSVFGVEPALPPPSHVPEAPVTVAQAGDAKVMGPGITEDVFLGGHAQADEAAMSAQQAARTEQGLVGPGPEAPEIGSVARRMHPELFDQYDSLAAQRDDLRAHLASLANPTEEAIQAASDRVTSLTSDLDAFIASRGGYKAGPQARALRAQIRDAQGDLGALRARQEAFSAGQGADTPEMAQVRQQILATDFAMRDLAADVSAAYRRAADAIGAGMIEPEVAAPEVAAPAPVETPRTGPVVPEQEGGAPGAPVPPSVEAQVQAIAQSVTAEMLAAGRPEAEARAAGELLGQRYKTRAARMLNVIGGPQALYESEGPVIRRGGRAAPAEAAGEAPKPTVDPAAARALAEQRGVTKLIEKMFGAGASDEEISTLIGGKLSADQVGAIRNAPTVDLNDQQLWDQLAGAGRQEKQPARLPGGYNPTTTKRGAALRSRATQEWQPGALVDVGVVRDLLVTGRNEDGSFNLVSRPNADGVSNAYSFARHQGIAKSGTVAFRDAVRDLRAIAPTTEPTMLELAQQGKIHPDVARYQDEIFEEASRTASDAGMPSGFVDGVYLVGSRASGKSKNTSDYDFVIHFKGDTSNRSVNDAWTKLIDQFQNDKSRTINVDGVSHKADFFVTDELEPGRSAIGQQRGAQTLAQPKRGSITFREGQRPVLKLFADADASTFIHESGHNWLEELMRDAAHPAASEGVISDAATVKKWLGIEGDKIATRQHEKFARGFEQYMREGTAPSTALAKVFAQFKSWLTSIYQTIKGLGAPINDDIRGVFDRMLAEEPQRTVVAPEREGPAALAAMHEVDAAEAHPAEAHGVGDRISSERDRYVAEQPPEIQNELATVEAERAAIAGAEPPGEAGAGAGGERPLGGPGSGAEPVPEGGPGSGQRGALVPGSGQGLPEGAGLPGGAGAAERAAAGAGLREQRSVASGAAGPQSAIAPRAADLLGPRESPFVDKAGNIRVENLTTDRDVAQAIRDSADANNDFIGERRGVITDGQVLDLADALGMNASDLSTRKIGQAFNAEQIVAARKLLIQSATDVSALMKRAATGTDEDVLAYAQAKARHQMIQGQVAGITAEAGRALRAFRSLAGQDMAKTLDQFLKESTAKTLFQLKAEAKLGALLDTPGQVSKFVADSRKPGFSDMVLEYWINGLVSGVRTQVTNIIGNTIQSIQVMGPETAAAAGIGALRRALGREGDVVHLGEVRAHLQAFRRSLPVSLKAMTDALRAGRSVLLPGEKNRPLPFETGAVTAPAPLLNEAATYGEVGADLFGMVRGLTDGILAIGKLVKSGGEPGSPALHLAYSPLGAIPDIAVRGTTVIPVGSALRLPTRMLAAMDSFFRAANYSMAKNGAAYRMATEEGLVGTAFDARLADLRENPTPEIMANSVSRAEELTFVSRRSEFVNALSNLANKKILGLPLMKFVVPFINTPANIIEQAVVARTPLGFFSPEIRADLMGKNGNVAQDTATAKMLVGTAYAIGFGALAAKGLMSGSGPSDSNDLAAWRMAGNQAHSVRIGDFWYDTRVLGSIGLLAGIAADLYDVAHAAEDGDMADAAASLQSAFTQNILDASWMTGPSDLIQALEDPGRYGQSYIRGFASSFVPFSGLMGQTARATDPYVRQARTVTDAIKAKVPGISQTLFPRRDVWGEPLPQRETLGPAMLSSVYMTQVSNDPVNVALSAAGYWPGQPQRKIRNVDLTDEQYDEYSRLAGRMAKQRLNVIVTSPDWQTWTPSIRHDVLQEVVGQSRETARGMMMAKYPSIVQQAVRAKLAPLRQEQP